MNNKILLLFISKLDYTTLSLIAYSFNYFYNISKGLPPVDPPFFSVSSCSQRFAHSHPWLESMQIVFEYSNIQLPIQESNQIPWPC